MFREVINCIYPSRCAICDEVKLPEEIVCPACTDKIKLISGDTCFKCGKSLRDTGKVYCYDCSRRIHYYDRGFSIFEYEDIKKSLYRFKYQGRTEYAAFYAYMADYSLGRVLRDLNADALIPVPIHKRRFRKRGYNQALVMANELSKLINVPVCNDLIFRKKSTIPLKELDEEGRRNNLKKAFIIRPNGVKLDTIVIIDDIYTTGATIDTISSLFRGYGVTKIYCLTVAIGRGL